MFVEELAEKRQHGLRCVCEDVLPKIERPIFGSRWIPTADASPICQLGRLFCPMALVFHQASVRFLGTPHVKSRRTNFLRLLNSFPHEPGTRS